MKETVSKFAFPVVLIVLGLILLGLGAKNDQNSWFTLASVGVLLAGVITLLNSLEIISKVLRYAVIGFLVVVSTGLAWMDYKSIKDPVEFMKERDRRYVEVIQRLKDVRQAQFAFKTSNNKYCDDFDTLMNFLKNDSLLVIKATGFLHDTMIGREDEALKLGLISRDSSFIPVAENVFNEKYLSTHKGAFYLDSLPYIPYTGRVKFKIQSGILERNGVTVQVFQVTDTVPFDPQLKLQVGSLDSPSTSGNWE